MSMLPESLEAFGCEGILPRAFLLISLELEFSWYMFLPLGELLSMLESFNFYK
jgi:hypothetical protein